MGIQHLIQWLIMSEWCLMYCIHYTLYQWCLLENVAFLAKDIQYSQFRIDLVLRWDCKHGIESLWFCFVKIAEMLMFAPGKYLVNILIKVCLLLRLTTHKYWYCTDTEYSTEYPQTEYHTSSSEMSIVNIWFLVSMFSCRIAI